MSFHFSMPVRSLSAAKAFFIEVLCATLEHEDPSGYINIDFHGAQLTLHELPDMSDASPDMHFGANLSVEAFKRLTRHIESVAPQAIRVPAKVVDAGTDRERHKLFVQSPEGYLIELKGMKGASE